MDGPNVKLPPQLEAELRRGNPYCCSRDGCRAALLNMNDLTPETVLKIASPGWTWDGARIRCPKHSGAA